MSNYTTENLVPVLNPENRVPAIRIGDQVFVMQTGGGGGATDFYKCASVDTVNFTWTGYKAVLSGGVYSFESTVTSGLTYTTVTPSVGQVYSADALIQANLYEGMPSSGLVFYASLAAASATAETGQVFSGTSNVSEYTVKAGIPCAKFTTSGSLTAPDTGLQSGSSPSTLTGWIYYDMVPDNWSDILTYGTSSSRSNRSMGTNPSNYFKSGSIDEDATGTVAAVTGQWYFIVGTYDGSGGDIKTYVNGSLVATLTPQSDLNVQLNQIKIGTDRSITAYIAAVRIYNRVLTSAEIATLYSEFTPSAGA